MRSIIVRHGVADYRDDLVQTVFLKGWKNFSKFRGESSIKTWIVRITMNVLHDHFRSHTRHRFESLIESPSREDPKISIELLECLGALDEASQSLIILFYLEEFSMSEISEILDLPIGTIKSRLSRIREKLYKIATDAGF